MKPPEATSPSLSKRSFYHTDANIVDSIVFGQATGVEHVSFYSRTENRKRSNLSRPHIANPLRADISDL